MNGLLIDPLPATLPNTGRGGPARMVRWLPMRRSVLARLHRKPSNSRRADCHTFRDFADVGQTVQRVVKNTDRAGSPRLAKSRNSPGSRHNTQSCRSACPGPARKPAARRTIHGTVVPRPAVPGGAETLPVLCTSRSPACRSSRRMVTLNRSGSPSQLIRRDRCRPDHYIFHAESQ
jgi:hypothetical protein